jgi:hypothetical protein
MIRDIGCHGCAWRSKVPDIDRAIAAPQELDGFDSGPQTSAAAG